MKADMMGCASGSNNSSNDDGGRKIRQQAAVAAAFTRASSQAFGYIFITYMHIYVKIRILYIEYRVHGHNVWG